MSSRCGISRLKRAAVVFAVLFFSTLIAGVFTRSFADYYDYYGNYYDSYGNLIYPAGSYYGAYTGYYDAYGNYYTDSGYYDIYGIFHYYEQTYSSEPVMSEDGLRATDPNGFYEYVPLFYPADVKAELVKQPTAEISMDWIGQNPEMPNGCEITAAAIALNFYGFPIEKTELAKEFYTAEKNRLDFRNYYVGNPFDWTGLGCWANAVTDATNSYLDTQDTDLHAFNYTNYLFEDLLNQVAGGYPVIIWASYGMQEPYYGVRFNIEGDDIVFISGEHCLVLNGYDLEKKIVKVSDPLVGQTEYDMDLFKKRFTQLGFQAVIIKTPEQKFLEDKDIVPSPFNDSFLSPEFFVRGCKGFDGVSEAD